MDGNRNPEAFREAGQPRNIGTVPSPPILVSDKQVRETDLSRPEKEKLDCRAGSNQADKRNLDHTMLETRDAVQMRRRE
jgi:hypothetical protein